MSIAILFFLVPIGAIVAWWLSQQRLMAKPWLEVGAIGELPDPGASSLQPSAPERAVVRRLLAFSACPLARLIQPPDAVGGRFRRYLPRIADLRRANSK